MVERPNCFYFDICGRPSVTVHGDKHFCLLHLPVPNKNVNDFNQAVGEYLKAGKSDFRYVYFNKQTTPPFRGVTFPGLADFQDAVFPGGELQLQRAGLPSGLSLSVENLSSLNLQGVTADGPISITGRGEVKSVNLDGAVLSKELTLNLGKTNTLSLQDSTLGGKVTIRSGETIDQASLRGATLRAGLELVGKRVGSLTFDRATVEGLVTIKVDSRINAQLPKSNFQGDLSVHAPEFEWLNLNWSEVSGRVSLQGRFHDIGFSMAKIKGTLAIRDSELKVNQETFNGTTFSQGSVLDFSGSSLQGEFKIAGASTPSEIILDDCKIPGTTTIQARLDAKPLLIAEAHSPQFGIKVSLANMDLSRCRLVGNSIRDMDFAGVRWASRCWRKVLYDEVKLRSGARIPYGSLKETYQLLKEKYSQMGDHATAGDFHYGEMEMKRREHGRLGRVFCPEFLYWALSGYGVGYVRSFLVLTSLVLLFACAYYWFEPVVFSCDFSKALLFSVQTSTLQRPLLPSKLSEVGMWLNALEMILGPIQIALFGLAVRMRLKR